jgi:hypothetical protein
MKLINLFFLFILTGAAVYCLFDEDFQKDTYLIPCTSDDDCQNGECMLQNDTNENWCWCNAGWTSSSPYDVRGCSQERCQVKSGVPCCRQLSKSS